MRTTKVLIINTEQLFLMPTRPSLYFIVNGKTWKHRLFPKPVGNHIKSYYMSYIASVVKRPALL